MIEHCHEQFFPDPRNTAQTLHETFCKLETSCTTTGEATAEQNTSGLHTGTDLRQSTRVAVVGPSNNDSEVQHRSRSTRQSLRAVATCTDA